MAQRFSASVAARHMACHASAQLELAIPGWTEPVRDDTVGAAAFGTSVHKIIEDLIATKHVTATTTTKFSAKDMLAVARILTYIGELWSTRRFHVLSETSVEAAWLTTKPKTTADLVLYVQDEIHVIDVKWGKVHVEVVDNDQLLYYDVCYAPLAPKAKGVMNHILQPRADNMNSWFADTTRLAKFMADAQATEAAIAAGDVTFGPSDHCKFCPAYPHSRGERGKPLCPATMQLLYPSHIDEDAILAL